MTDPPESNVYTQIIESLSDLQTGFNVLTNTVNEINDDIGDLTKLTTVNKLNIVESINEVNSKSSVSIDDELSNVSTNPVRNNVITLNIDSINSNINDLSDCVNDLQTAVQSKVWDVQINGTSVVSDGVANIPLATESSVGVYRADPNFGTGIYNQRLMIARASDDYIRNGVNGYRPIVPSTQHSSTFYGLAKVVGYDEKNSTLPIWMYSEEAKTAIRTMLGLQEMYEWYKNQT